jgi:hypothetical protein
VHAAGHLVARPLLWQSNAGGLNFRQADFLVTGDKELFSLQHHKSTRIITPAAMIDALIEEG